MSDDTDDSDGRFLGPRLLVIALVLAALLAVIYVVRQRAQEEPIPAPAPMLPPPPPCIDNRCAERPGYLKCVEYSNGSPASCSMWKFLYENNCVCHEWGPRPPALDGGAP